MGKKILIVDDEKNIVDILKFNLKKEGFTTIEAFDGEQAVELAFSENPDLILLDVMLPKMDGFTVCRKLRQSLTTPIIMLTAKEEEVDKVLGLELGADDYITKPYSTRELLARIRAALRRFDAPADDRPLSEGDGVIDELGIRLDVERHTVSVRGEEVSMPLREFELLDLLMRHSGRVLTRGQLIDRVWGSDYYGDTKTLDVHVKRIRSRIESDPKDPKILTTVRGVGYRFG